MRQALDHTRDGKPARAADIVRKIRLIPDEHREFGITGERAQIAYRLTPALLAELAELGLPYSSRGGERLFDHHDLVNVSLELGLPSAWALGLRWWRDALADDAAFRYCQVGYTFTCPDPGHPGACQVDVLTPDSGWVRQEFGDRRPARKLDFVSNFQLRTRWPALPAQARALAGEMARLSFAILPMGLIGERRFAERTGLADCATASQMLVDNAAAHNIEARFSSGLAVVTPFSMRHCWAEFRVDDMWVPVDPLMVATLVRWGVLDGGEWAPHRSLGAILSRLAGELVAPTKHNGRHLMMTLRTVRLDGPHARTG